MMITLTNNAVAANALHGTIVGTLVESAVGDFRFIRLWGMEFTVNGNKLVTSWIDPIAPGLYSVLILAWAGLNFDLGSFQITVGPPNQGRKIVGDPTNVIIVRQPLPPP